MDERQDQIDSNEKLRTTLFSWLGFFCVWLVWVFLYLNYEDINCGNKAQQKND